MHPDRGGLYLAAVLHLCTRRIVGWAMADHLGHELALAALDRAIARQRPPSGLIHHADRGVQFAAHRHRARLLAHGMLCSMSRTGDCWDNAPMESFFATLNGKLVAEADYQMRDHARNDVFHCIEGFYSKRRSHSAFGHITPEQKAAAFQSAASTAQSYPRKRGRPSSTALGHLTSPDGQGTWRGRCHSKPRHEHRGPCGSPPSNGEPPHSRRSTFSTTKSPIPPRALKRPLSPASS